MLLQPEIIIDFKKEVQEVSEARGRHLYIEVGDAEMYSYNE